MRLLPSRAQWAGWSLPSKLTAIGAYTGIVGIALAVGGVLLSIGSQERESARAQGDVAPAKNQTVDPASSSHLQRENAAAATDRPESLRRGDALALDELLTDLNRKDLTRLQREQMRDRLSGRRVTWRVSVRDVTRLFDGDVLLLFVAPSQQSELSPDVMSAAFPAVREASLTGLRKGDFAVIEGSLGFTEWGLSTWLPELADAELLSFSTESQEDRIPSR